jgi:formamidopyrimidine-DNA glycosylase
VPELPEVETIARGLAPLLTGRRIVEAASAYPPIARPDFPTFRDRAVGRRIVAVRRRAKLLILDLDGPDGGGPASSMHLVFHLKMSGSMSVGPTAAEAELADKHTHLLLRLDDGTTFFFREVRKFGYAAAMTGAELADWAFYRSLGPEPLETTADEFVARFPYKGRPADASPPRSPGLTRTPRLKDGRIKALLLDQTVIAGIGNIYADESLFRASIHPETRASALTRTQLVRLHLAVQEVLAEAIAASGSSIRDYRDAHGFEGGFQNSFQVYGKSGEPCPACGRKLESIRVVGRTTTFCPKCQPPGRTKQSA